jgi:hypothetical protein
MIEHLIACGQFAMCFNLLEYLELMQVDPGYDKHPDKAALDQLHADMMKHWKAFREDPFLCYRNFKKNISGLPSSKLSEYFFIFNI